MVGMPSRLTAPANERKKRTTALFQAKQAHAIKNYQGIRMDSKGRRFLIHNARIWTLWDEEGPAFGQAASFTNWSLI